MTKRLRWTTCTLGVWCLAVGMTWAQDPAGRWRGEWYSQPTGHRGPMNARIRPLGDGTYSARFTGRFALVIPFTYRVDLVPDGCGQWVAEKRLGPLMGSYRMQTRILGNSMTGQFQANKDVGSVSMQRVR